MGPVPVSGPFIPDGAGALLGEISAISADPVPLVLLPGYEYHISEWFDERGERHWVLERRRAAASERHWLHEGAPPEM